jgi:hypothetical protein
MVVKTKGTYSPLVAKTARPPEGGLLLPRTDAILAGQARVADVAAATSLLNFRWLNQGTARCA